MTMLRDARLARALDYAPDQAEVPDARARTAIRKVALEALAVSRPVPVPRPWWRRLWAPAPGAARMPWNAALATVLLASLVTLLWHDREPPGARLDGPADAATQPAGPALKREDNAALAGAPAGDSADAPAARREAAAPPAAPPPAPPPGPTARASKPGSSSMAKALPAPRPSQPIAPERGAVASRSAPASPSAAPAPAPAPEVASPSAPAPFAEQAGASQAAAPLAQAPAASPPAPAAMARSAPAAKALGGLAADRAVAAPAAMGWADVLIREGGRELRLPRAQAARLAALLQPLWPSAQAWAGAPLAPPLATADIQLELQPPGEAVVTLALSAQEAQWSQRDAAGLRRITQRPGTEVLAALREEIKRLLPAR
ncbi:MAG: hypothetical protein KF796_21145 [Ramlibacter sp.]|nr:hypothetical protein [Ramlibacter sp.]